MISIDTKCHFPGSTTEILNQTALELEVTLVATKETEARRQKDLGGVELVVNQNLQV